MNNISQKKEKNQPISVYVRVRPMSKQEIQASNINICEIRGKELTVKNNITEKYHRSFVFDKIFGPESKQIDVFKTVAEPAVAEIITGYNCTIFAYGQTGTGKTYTMAGGNETSLAESASWKEEEDAGIIPRTLSYLFDELRVQQIEYTVRVSYLELYNEEIFDLLSPPEDTNKLKLFDDVQKKGSVIIQGLTEVSVSSKSEVYKILESGAEKRRKATTLMNAQSSRSHTIFSVTVHTKESSCDGEDLLKMGKLNLVDLAGSENISKSGVTDKRARETSMINTSLLTLGRCIVALTEHRGHIPYRESKLTRLLRDSLGGRTKTSLIATVSPALYNLEETLNTLDYASRAKHITNKPEMNQRLTKNAVLKDYQDQIMKLQKDLQASRLGTGVYVDKENYDEMIKQMTFQKQEIGEKINHIRALEEQRDEKERICDELKMVVQQHIEVVETKTKQIEELATKLDHASTEISKLEVENEEKEFLVAKHADQEKILHVTAVKLLNTVEGSTQDVEKLHSKLDVLADIEKYNKSVYEQFITEFNSKINHIKNRSSNFQSDQNKFHKFLIDSTNEIKTKQDEINSLYSNIIGRYGEFKTSLGLHEDIMKCKQNDIETKITSTKDSATNLTHVNETEIQHTYDQNFHPTFEDMFKHLQLSHQTMINVYSSFQEIIEDNSCHIQDSIKTLRKDLSDAELSVNTKIEDAKQFISKVVHNVVSSAVEEQEIQKKAEKEMDTIIKNVINVKNMLNQQQLRSKHLSKEAINNLSSIETTLQNCVSNVECMAKNALLTTNCISDNLEYTDESSKKLINKYTTTNTELLSIGQSLNERCVSLSKYFVADVQKRFNDQNNLLSSCVDEIKDMSSETFTVTHNFLKDFTEKLEEQCGHHVTISNDTTTFYNSICKKVQSEVQSNNSNCSQHESHLNTEFDDCCELQKKMFKTYLKEYKPTGYTPIRKKYKYPKNVPPATNSEELLEDFRKVKFQIAEEIDENECNNEIIENNENNFNETENQDPNISVKIEEKISVSKLEENEESGKKKKILSDNSQSNIPLRQKN